MVFKKSAAKSSSFEHKKKSKAVDGGIFQFGVDVDILRTVNY